MDNAYWIKYICEKLRERGVWEDKPFSFDSKGKELEFKFEQREKIPLIKSRNLLLYNVRSQNNYQVGEVFRMRILDTEIHFNALEADRTDELYADIYERRRHLELEHINVILGRSILFDKRIGLEPLALNFADFVYDCKEVDISQSVYFGEDFSAPDPSSFALEADGKEHEEFAGYESAKIILLKSMFSFDLAAHYPEPGEMADNFVDMAVRMSARKIGH